MAHNRVQGSKNQGDNYKTETTNKEQTGQWPSETENKTRDQDTDRNSDTHPKELHGYRNDERNFDLLVDGVPYSIRSIPFLYNDETRFRVIINGDVEHIFTWDSEIKMLRAISEKLQSMK